MKFSIILALVPLAFSMPTPATDDAKHSVRSENDVDINDAATVGYWGVPAEKRKENDVDVGDGVGANYKYWRGKRGENDLDVNDASTARYWG